MGSDKTEIWDVRTYRLEPESRDAFYRLFQTEALPMLERHGIRVVAYGRSLLDPDSFVLIRAFSSAEERESLLGAFYNGQEWMEKYDRIVMGMIRSYQVVVIPAPNASKTSDTSA